VLRPQEFLNNNIAFYNMFKICAKLLDNHKIFKVDNPWTLKEIEYLITVNDYWIKLFSLASNVSFQKVGRLYYCMYILI